MCKTDYCKLLKVAVISQLLIFAVSWTNVVNFAFACLAISFSYLLFIWYMCKKYQAECSCTQLVVAVLIGRYLLDFVSRVVTPFKEGAGSLPEPFVCLLAIILGIFCHKKPNVLSWVVSVALIIIVCSIIPDWWDENYRDWLKQ